MPSLWRQACASRSAQGSGPENLIVHCRGGPARLDPPRMPAARRLSRVGLATARAAVKRRNSILRSMATTQCSQEYSPGKVVGINARRTIGIPPQTWMQTQRRWLRKGSRTAARHRVRQARAPIPAWLSRPPNGACLGSGRAGSGCKQRGSLQATANPAEHSARSLIMGARPIRSPKVEQTWKKTLFSPPSPGSAAGEAKTRGRKY